MTETQEIVTLRNTMGDSVALTGPIYLTEHDGFGLAQVRRYTRSGPQQHGQTLGAAYLRPRVVTMKLQYQTTNEPGLETQRERLERMLNDLNHPIYLDVQYPSGNIRRLDVYYYDGLPAKRAGAGLWNWQADVLQLIADDPAWYDPTPLLETWYAGPEYYYGGGSGWTVEMFVPVMVAPSSMLVDEALIYSGSWDSYPVWSIYGPASHVRIDNLSTGETIQFTAGGFVEPNDIWTIDLRYGYKTVRNLANMDQIEFITEDSDLATWHLGGHPEVNGGANHLRILASDCNSDSKIQVSYLHRYRGS